MTEKVFILVQEKSFPFQREEERREMSKRIIDDENIYPNKNSDLNSVLNWISYLDFSKDYSNEFIKFYIDGENLYFISCDKLSKVVGMTDNDINKLMKGLEEAKNENDKLGRKAINQEFMTDNEMYIKLPISERKKMFPCENGKCRNFIGPNIKNDVTMDKKIYCRDCYNQKCNDCKELNKKEKWFPENKKKCSQCQKIFHIPHYYNWCDSCKVYYGGTRCICEGY